jgi:hypothetical protein
MESVCETFERLPVNIARPGKSCVGVALVVAHGVYVSLQGVHLQTYILQGVNVYIRMCTCIHISFRVCI